MIPKSFKTKEDLYNKFMKYVKYCQEHERLANVAGFCAYIHINRDTFYKQKEYYEETFNELNQILEDEALNCKHLGDSRIIFYMKNKCGYKDKQEIENNVSVNPYSNLTEEELKVLVGE